MTTHQIRRSVSAGALALLVLTAPACSKDDDAKDASPTTSASDPSAEANFCKFAKETVDPTNADREAVVAYFDGLVERAPSTIKADAQAARTLIATNTDPEADSITKSEAAIDGQEAFGRLMAFLNDNCGMNIDLNASGTP